MRLIHSQKISLKKKLLAFLLFVVLFLIGYAKVEMIKYDARTRKNSPIYYACKKNDPELLRKMICLQEIPDVNTCPYYEVSSIAYVVHWTCPLVRERRTTTKDIKEWDRRATTFMTILIQNGATLRSDSMQGAESLIEAARFGLEDTTKLLLETGLNPNLEPIRPGVTALHETLRGSGTGRRRNIVKMLIEYGADVNSPNYSLGSPLHIAMGPDADLLVIELLLEAGANVNVTNKVGDTPLHDAASYQSTLIVKCLLERGADPFLKNDKGQTALDIARSRPNPDVEIIQLLETYMEKYKTSNTESE